MRILSNLFLFILGMTFMIVGIGGIPRGIGIAIFFVILGSICIWHLMARVEKYNKLQESKKKE